MSELKSYTCAKCGAVLSVDKLQGQLACPFCGTGFNYIDFHRDELISRGEDCLARGAYTSAKEKFNQVLKNNPKDIRAIRGLILAAGRVHTTEDLQDRHNLVSSDLDAIKKIVASANKIDTEEERIYLDDLVCLFEIPYIYNDIADRKNETMKLEKKRGIQLEVKDERDGRLSPVFGLMIALIIGALAMLCTSDLKFPEALIFISIIVLCGFVIYFIIKSVGSNKGIVKIPESSNSLSDRMEDIEEKYSEILYEVLEFEANLKNKPSEETILKEAKTPEPEHETAPETKTTSRIICAKCGGLLKLNNVQELYECNSCGVSYGKALFFGDLTANAVKAMNMGEFAEADQILSYKLMVDPKDFESLFGRFLCAGKWKSLADINLGDRLLRFHLKDLPKQLDVIEKRISKEDQPLWGELRNLSDLLLEYAVRMAAFNKVREKYVSICGKLNDDLMSKEIKDYTRQKTEIYEKLTVLDGECTETGDRINEAIKVLTDSYSDCIFFDGE